MLLSVSSGGSDLLPIGVELVGFFPAVWHPDGMQSAAVLLQSDIGPGELYDAEPNQSAGPGVAAGSGG